MSSYAIDLEAQRREVQYPNGIPVNFSKKLDLLFPAELPADALDPLLSAELDLVGLLADIMRTDSGTAVGEVIEVLFKRPRLPKQFLAAIRETYALLLDEDQYEQFIAARPSIGDYVRLSTALIRVYGVDLGKLFGSAGSSAPDGATSSPTSSGTTDSTPGASGFAQDSPASSDSAG
ncbi:hypothetical protein [Streptomyces sp. NPDC058758]|uniref:hypothetical protein n=1 Tax=Streptomyces sp. NPDC058758 TaxID=3346627 RepID=UPI0036C14952